jgi:hypothetical protein
MALADRVYPNHRALLDVLNEAVRVPKEFDDEQTFHKKPLGKQDAARYARDRYICLLPAVMTKIEQVEYNIMLPVGWMGPAYSCYKKETLGKIIERAGVVVRRLVDSATTMPSTQDPAAKTQYFGRQFDSLAIIAVPVGYQITPPGTISPLVYAWIESNDVVRYVNSSNHNVRHVDIEFFARALELGYMEEIRFERSVNRVSTCSSCRISLICRLHS